MKKMTPRLLTVLVILLLSTFIACPSYAQTYPAQPIQMILTLAPGDTLDLTGRAIGAEMSKILKTPVLPNNRTGGAGMVGADFVAKGKKDGYTILYINSNIIYSYAANPENVPYNPFQDLEPLCLAVSVPLLLAVQPESPWKSFQELLSYMKQNPGKIRGSSTGVGSVGHFGYEVIRTETGTEINMIPYKGASPGLTALLGGHVEVAIPSFSLVQPQLQAGKVRILLTSKKIPDYPQIPTLTQLGYKRDMSSVWFGFFIPVGVPDPAKKVLTSALEKSIKSGEVAKTLQTLGALEDYKPAGEFKKMMMEEYDIIKNLFKAATPPSK
ncbi:MAG TPA: tripartite tricarboxylate transporter substrate binding protein [Thermodesulfobacteriota bacterium]|nr:tripartite tricarboxylate transporter substrate binding protein [Thermodesulfobacteriota bacterium]